MKNLLALTVALLIALVPFHSPAAPGTDSVAGLTFAGTDSEGDHYVFTFEPDGTLAYTSPSGSFRDAQWHQHGQAIYLAVNKHYSEYLGQLDGDRITGKAWNTVGHTWKWDVTKTKKGGAAGTPKPSGSDPLSD